MMTFIQADPQNLTKILSHLQTSAIMDLLLTLVRMEELPEGKGVVKVTKKKKRKYSFILFFKRSYCYY